MAKFEDLRGETLTAVEGLKTGSEEVTLRTASGRAFRMWHNQDCCEFVRVEDVVGDVADIIGTPILLAEEAVSAREPGLAEDGATWTFYKLATVRGDVTIRWLGESNGYYSEAVDFDEMVP